MAISGLNKQEAITLLQRQGLSTAQQAQILSSAGLLQTTQMLNASLIEEVLTHTTLSTEKQKELLVSLGLADAKTKELITSNECTVAEVAQALATKGIIGADAEAILSQLGLATANTTTTVSFAGLTTAIKANTVAMAKWLVTNPVGWCILAVGAIYGLTKAYDALTVSEKEMAEAHEESVQKAKDSVSEYEELKQELETIQQTYDDNEQKLKDLYKLRENQTITQAEQDYLEELEGQNEKLRQQIEYKQTLADIEAKEAEDNAVTALNEKTQDDSLTGRSTNGGATVEFDKITDAEKIKQNTATINALTADLTAYEKVIQGIELSQEEVDKYTQQLIGYQEQLNAVEGESDYANSQREFYQGKIDEIQGLLNGTLTYEEYEKAVSMATSSVQSLVTENDTLLQKVEPLNDAIKSTTGENYELKKANDEIIANAKDAAIGFNEYTDSLNGTADALNNVQGSTSDNEITVSFTEALSQINAFSEGLDQLGEIYADVKDKENFDFTSLLTDDFKETFGGFTEEYENLVKTITESPNDINACQDAFNSLATAYIYSTDALKNVTDETKNSTVALLKQMGVSNALDVVNNQLAINTSSLEKAQSNLNEAKKQGLTASVDLENATASELIKIMEESEQLGINIDDLYYYTLQKLQANEINIVTDGDLDALASLCDGLGVATTALKRYEEVKGRMSSLDSEYANRDKDSNYYARQKKILAEYDALENEMSKSASKILASKVQNKYKPTTTVKYTGSTDKDSSKDSSKDSTETFDWIENKLKAISNEIDTLDTKAGATWDTWANRNKALSQEIGKVTEQIKLQEKAANKYLSLFNGVNISDAYRKKIMSGEMNIEEITNEELADKIKKAQEYWDNYITNKNDANEGRNTLASKVKEQFDNLKSESQANIDAIESQIDKLNDNMDIAETKGYYITEDYYNNLINKENDKISALTSQAKTLQDQLDSAVANGIKKGSEDWQSMKDEIDGVIDEINETKKSIIELQVEIAKTNFENIQTKAENFKNAIEHEIQIIESGMNLRETIGKKVSGDSYDSIELLSLSKKANLEQEISDLYTGLKKFEVGTQNYEDALQEIREKEEELAQLEVDIAQNTIDRFNNEMEKASSYDRAEEVGLNHKISKQNTAMELKELNGQLVTSSDYDALNNYQKRMSNNLQDQYNQMVSALEEAISRGEIKIGDDNWIQAWEDIYAKEEEIAESNKTIAQNTIDRFNNEMEKASSYDRAEEVGLNHKLNSQSTAMELKEINGKNVTSADYKILNDYQQRMTDNLQDQRDKMATVLEDAINRGDIKIGDERWVKAWEDIYAKDEEIAESNKTIAENTKKGVDADISNVQEGFDKIQNAYAHESSVIQGAISNYEANGYSATEELYDALIQNSENSISAYKNEKSRLEKILNDGLLDGSIVEGDDQYWTIIESFNDIDSSIIDAENDIVGFNNSIQQLKWDSFDSLMDKITDITEETNFLNSLIEESDWFDDTGKITGAGEASAALHLMNINTYKSQVKDYGKELLKINKDLASDPANQTLLDRKEELLSTQRDLVNSIQDEQDAIISLAEKGYGKLKESLDEVIDKRKEALNAEKSLYDYQKSIEEKTNKRDSLQKQLNALSGDTSEEARIEAQKLQLELNEANKDLEQTQYDKWISDQEQMLDNFATDTQEWIDERLKDTNGLLAEIRDSVANSSSIDNVLKTIANEYGIELSSEMLQTLSTSSNVDTSKAIDSTKSLVKMSEDTVKISDNVAKILDEISNVSAKQENVAYNVNLKGYASGSHRIPKDQLAITQEKGLEFIARDGGLLTSLNKGDMIFTNEMTERLWKMAQGNIPFGVVQPNVNLPVVEPKTQSNNITIDLGNLTLPNVKNYEQFKDALIRDSSFEKSVKSMALDKAFGRNSLNKLRY